MSSSVLSRISAARAAATLARDARGSTAITFAIASGVLFSLLGAAIDYGRMTQARQRLQSALDSGTLAAASRRALNHDDAAGFLTAFVAADFTKTDGSAAPTTTYDEPNDTTIVATAHIDLPASFARLMGWKSFPITVRSNAAFGTSAVEVALVLDTTGSMAGSKITSLQDAANQLVTAAYSGPNAATKVKVSIVPFAQYVNVGTTYAGASWLSNTTPYSTSENVCTYTYATPNPVCTTRTGTGYNDGIPYSYTYQDCGPSVAQCSMQPVQHTWNGCVGSRAFPQDVSQPKADSSSKVPGLMDTWCAAPLLRLTNDQTAITSAIGSLSASGETYLPSGLIWGWRTLSPEVPFADGSNPNTPPKKRKVMVLMTDGVNTLAPTYPAHDDWGNNSLADQLTAQLCTNIKAAGIELYTIAFSVTDQAGKDRLAACSSGPPYYYDAQNGTQLADAFSQIGRSLAAVRLTQ